MSVEGRVLYLIAIHNYDRSAGELGIIGRPLPASMGGLKQRKKHLNQEYIYSCGARHDRCFEVPDRAQH